MSGSQHRWLALWAALLTALICFLFLPVSLMAASLCFVFGVLVIGCIWYFVSNQRSSERSQHIDGLPEATYRQPVVLVCGDLAQNWPENAAVLTVTQGCWIRVEPNQDLEQIALQILRQRPNWGRQLSVMVNVCPQQHSDTETLSSYLLVLRWQLSQLRKSVGYQVPFVLSGQIGSAIFPEMLWQASMPEEGIRVWKEDSAPFSLASWQQQEGRSAQQQQILIQRFIEWFELHVTSSFTQSHPDIPTMIPTAMLWGFAPHLNGDIQASIWKAWLSRHTSLQHVAGWHPVNDTQTAISLFPNFVLPLLPEGGGLTPSQRASRCGFSLFTLAGMVALLCSGWNNFHLMQRVSFDIKQYQQIPMTDYVPKAKAVNVLRDDASQLDDWARNGEPLQLGLGLYVGERLRLPVLEQIKGYVPPPPPPKPKPKPKPIPKTVRLNSMSLFNSGKAELKEGSTKMLVTSLVGIKAKPGWLIVVAGHTDDTGDETLNQTLSLKRAEAVRDWMRDTGDVPESCFAVQGYGETRPVATNDTPEGRALNRRVEITLVPQANACVMPESTASSGHHDALQQNGE
ncbi:MAG: OmpA family protein [Vibrio sp.]